MGAGCGRSCAQCACPPKLQLAVARVCLTQISLLKRMQETHTQFAHLDTPSGRLTAHLPG